MGKAAGAAGSAAAGGWVSAGAQIVDAIFSGLSFFQGRRVETDVARIEVTTRGIFNAFWNSAGLVDCAVWTVQRLDSIRDILSAGLKLDTSVIAIGGGGGNISIDMRYSTFNGVNSATADSFVNDVVGKLRRRMGVTG